MLKRCELFAGQFIYMYHISWIMRNKNDSLVGLRVLFTMIFQYTRCKLSK